uniref:Uncharacterized protein n=1 Tax=viral metagenome TaxID=1070528 RepID=A0A6M3M229_9ZZZZ
MLLLTDLPWRREEQQMPATKATPKKFEFKAPVGVKAYRVRNTKKQSYSFITVVDGEACEMHIASRMDMDENGNPKRNDGRTAEPEYTLEQYAALMELKAFRGLVADGTFAEYPVGGTA